MEMEDPPPAVPCGDSRRHAPPRFDPSRMIGIIKRKAMIKDLAAAYHAECLAHCQELLELQQKGEEPYIDIKTPNNTKKEAARSTKRYKKSH